MSTSNPISHQLSQKELNREIGEDPSLSISPHTLFHQPESFSPSTQTSTIDNIDICINAEENSNNTLRPDQAPIEENLEEIQIPNNNTEQQQAQAQARQHATAQLQTVNVPLYRRVAHALCLTLTPFIITRILAFALLKCNLFSDLFQQKTESSFFDVISNVMTFFTTNQFFFPTIASSSSPGASPAASLFKSVSAITTEISNSVESGATLVEGGTSLIDKIIYILVKDFGYDPNWWVTKTTGFSIFLLYSFFVTLLVSFAAAFHSFGIVFIVARKWHEVWNFTIRLFNSDLFRTGIL